MPVTKRARYEVLKRDNHTCRYCHATDSPLTVDHVTPVALGGSDDPTNLVAACRDCNAGKGSTSPTEETVAQVGEDDMRWAAAVQRAATAMLEEHAASANRHKWFYDEWAKWDDTFASLPSGTDQSLDHWLGAGLPQTIILEALDIALSNRGVAHAAVFAYMGGVCRARIEKLHADARTLLEGGANGA